MFLLAYRSSKHESTGVTPAELYFAQDLRLPLDLLRGNPPRSNEKESRTVGGYVKDLREKLEEIHSTVKKRMSLRSSRIKTWYDRRARQVSFHEGQKVWLYNPRRKMRRTP